MGRMMAALVVALGVAGPAAAQEWSAPGGSAEGHASICLPGEGTPQVFTSLCLSVGCAPGEAASFGLSLQQVPLPPATRVTISVDGRVAADFVLPVEPGNAGGAVPLEGQEDLLAALRSGEAARLRIGAVAGWREYEVPLSGARAAIDAALAACPVAQAQGNLGQVPPGSASENPVADALADNESACAGGVTGVEPGLVRQEDVDGDGTNDVIIDFQGLTCDGSRLFCGTGGCTQEIWLGDPSGPYRLVLSDLIVRIERPAPGRVRVTMDGGDCGLSGAEVCRYEFRVEHGRLRPLD